MTVAELIDKLQTTGPALAVCRTLAIGGALIFLAGFFYGAGQLGTYDFTRDPDRKAAAGRGLGRARVALVVGSMFIVLGVVPFLL